MSAPDVNAEDIHIYLADGGEVMVELKHLLRALGFPADDERMHPDLPPYVSLGSLIRPFGKRTEAQRDADQARTDLLQASLLQASAVGFDMQGLIWDATSLAAWAAAWTRAAASGDDDGISEKAAKDAGRIYRNRTNRPVPQAPSMSRVLEMEGFLRRWWDGLRGDPVAVRAHRTLLAGALGMTPEEAEAEAEAEASDPPPRIARMLYRRAAVKRGRTGSGGNAGAASRKQKRGIDRLPEGVDAEAVRDLLRRARESIRSSGLVIDAMMNALR